MQLLRRQTGKWSKTLPAVLTAIFLAALVLGIQVLIPQKQQGQGQEQGQGGEQRYKEAEAIGPRGGAAAAVPGSEYFLLAAVWTTAHIAEKGIAQGKDTGLIVTYLAPAGRNPSTRKDWIGIYQRGNLTKSGRVDWDWVCPNQENRCKSFGAAAIPAGDDGMESGKTYTIAYWTDDATEATGTPAATLEYVVSW
ncbi:hypothetical protein [Streptomyces albipurpureus]|uniref:Secreted protein n=1 Tax=Streptomyces albipurpureus TaxID=2897419 RepID=A0ABT0UPG5_9ACTN|nr:hypothetical protein [Streptomyces sp. CWNU-1]MCM2390517.1 hypothetical protein [Streptomyces sp. CWNU-1]